MNAFWTQLDSQIVTFFNPLASDPSVRAAVRNDWPLHRLDHAVYIAIAYLTTIIGCKLLLDKGEKKVAEKKGKLSVAEKIKQDGIVVFVLMVLYNATQVALCGWMVHAALVEHRRRGFSVVCNEHKLSEDGMALVLHVFYLSKMLDFADTIFMIVKRNWRQVSFLHVYHHTSIWLFYWLNANSNYNGDTYGSIVLNGSIHFVMYGYYLATTFNIHVPTFIKKSITNAQLVQFCTMETQGACLLLMTGCESPRNVTILYMVYISTMLALFLNFRARNYSSSRNAKLKANTDADSNSDAASTVASESEARDCCGWIRGGAKKEKKVQ